MTIEVIKPGIQTSIQDGGRTGYMHWGVARGGAMDSLSMTLANWLVHNSPEHPVLEICLLGPSLRFHQNVSIAISGAKFDVDITNKAGVKTAVNMNETVQISAGDTLTFGKRLQGARAYLAIAADLSSKPGSTPDGEPVGESGKQRGAEYVLGSYSTHFAAEFAGFAGRALQAGDELTLTNCEQRSLRKLPATALQYYTGNYVLRCVPSVETNQFTEAQLAAFYRSQYTLRSDSNRMGLRFDGEPLLMEAMGEMVSSGLVQGSVQLPPSGLPIVSSVDGQTIGGYPRIANVISADLFALGQLVAGDKVSFKLVSFDYAEALYANQQAALF